MTQDTDFQLGLNHRRCLRIGLLIQLQSFGFLVSYRPNCRGLASCLLTHPSQASLDFTPVVDIETSINHSNWLERLVELNMVDEAKIVPDLGARCRS